MMLVQRKNTEVGDDTKGMTIETGIRFNSAPNGGHSRSMAHTMSHRSRTCHCECHLYAAGDSTLELSSDPELLKVSGLTLSEKCSA
jgi:hypothetical protein